MNKATEKILRHYLQRDDIHDSDEWFVEQIIAAQEQDITNSLESHTRANLIGGIIVAKELFRKGHQNLAEKNLTDVIETLMSIDGT